MDNSEKKARESLQQLRRDNKNSNYSKPSAKTDNLDADNDFTSDSESSSSDSSEDDQRQPAKRVESQSKEGRQVRRSLSSPVHKKKNDDKSMEEKDPRRVEKTKEDSECSTSESDKETKKKNREKNNDEPAQNDQDRLRALFAKRTVGDAFTTAQERYWQRKKLRTSGFAVTCS